MTPDYEYKGKCHIRFFNCDNMEFMKEVENKEYAIGLVDPPYGISANKMTLGNGKKKIYRGQNNWDSEIPKKYYFNELFRVSKNQVIWGGNYMTEHLNPTGAWLFWDKGTGENDFADGELAWTSFNGVLRKINKSWVGANAKNGTERIHPTEKPIYLYRWLLQKYAKQGDKIIDTHGGSMTLARACYEEGFDLDIMELDKEYFDKGVLAFKQHVSQYNLFQQ